MTRAARLPLSAATLLLTATACVPAPQVQLVEVWVGHAQVLLTRQQYRLTFTVNGGTHDLRGTLENLSSRDRFLVAGTALPAGDGREVSMTVTAQDGVRLNASILGFGFTNLSLKANAVLSARQTGRTMTGKLNVNGLGHPITLPRVQ